MTADYKLHVHVVQLLSVHVRVEIAGLVELKWYSYIGFVSGVDATEVGVRVINHRLALAEVEAFHAIVFIVGHNTYAVSKSPCTHMCKRHYVIAYTQRITIIIMLLLTVTL